MRMHKNASVRTVALLIAFIMLLSGVSCGGDKKDDSSMTQSLLKSYMDSLCGFDISGMNKCCLAALESYGDSKQAVKACESIAGRIEWENGGISISGNAAVAKLKLMIPDGMADVCMQALDDTVSRIDRDGEGNPYEIFVSAVKKRIAKADVTEIPAEISMTKIDNKWYVEKSDEVNGVVSEIRTSVAAAFAILGS